MQLEDIYYTDFRWDVDNFSHYKWELFNCYDCPLDSFDGNRDHFFLIRLA